MKDLEKTPQRHENAPRQDLKGAPEEFEKPKTKSIGEKLWHFTTYTGVGYVANLLVSIVIWDFFLTGKGRPALDKMAKGVGNILKAAGMKEKAAMAAAKTPVEMACSPLGGHMVMLPVMFMENHARYCCHVANKAFDPNYQYRDLKVTINTPDRDLPPMVDEPDKQTLLQIAARRGLAWAAVTASGTALNKFQGGKYQDMLEQGTLNLANKGIQMSGIPALQRLGQLPVTQRYLKLAALDSYFTVITSSVVAMTNYMFGDNKKKTPEQLEKPEKFAAKENKPWQGRVGKELERPARITSKEKSPEQFRQAFNQPKEQGALSV